MPTTPTYTFDPGLSTQKDYVRWRVGDTTGQPQWFIADQTIQVLLSEYDLNETAAQCAENIGGQFLQLAQATFQKDLRIDYGDRSKKAYELADRIRNDAMSDPDEPQQTGATFGQMFTPELSGYLVEIPTRLPPWSL